MVLGLLLLDLIAFLSFVFFTEESADSQQGCRAARHWMNEGTLVYLEFITTSAQ